ncbi:uncharacterized protein LOC134258963 [Saccostrea cucullata]|uniref:uncharacterized protein LOC134258963 n=1 Tax=Saccostrea cuccullata TaxID=36930 RepID=UPI002ECFF606
MPRYYCVAEGCSSDSRKKGRYGFMADVEFFAFPTSKQPKLRKKWLELVRRHEFDPSRHDKICSKHFVEGRPTEAHPYPELYLYINYKRPQETRGTSSIEKRSTCTTSEATPTKYESTPRPKTTGFLVHDENERKQPFPFPVEREITVQSLMTAEQIAAPHDHDYCSVGNEVVHSSDVQCQTDLTLHDLEKSEAELLQLRDTFKNKDDLRRYMTVDKMTNSDSSVMSYFGLPSVLTLFGIFAILDKITPTLAYWKGGSAIPNTEAKNPSKKSGPNRKLTRFHEFLVTLLRLRLALPTFVIADSFGISCTRVSQIFVTWISYMNTVFSPLLKRPSSKCLKKFMPKCFKSVFPKTASIIDCTEFFIERPSTPTAQIRTFSSYKQKNTFKALVAVTPSGAFMFVSNLWGGNVSDRYITEHSGFLDLVKPGDEVMADRGFLIRDLLLERRATLNIPPFTKKCSWGKGKHLTAHDILKTKKIAKLRIHVERAIGRLKNYKILSHTIPLKIKPLCNQILRVCAF